MAFRVKFAAMTVIAAVVLLALALAMWPHELPASASPISWALAYVLIAIECLGTGAGIAFFALVPSGGVRLDRRVAVAFIALGFLLIVWWPLGYLRSLAFDASSAARPAIMQGIYAFHDIFMVASAVLAPFLVQKLAAKAAAPSSRFASWRWAAVMAIGVAVISLPLTSFTYAALRLPPAPLPSAWQLPGLLLNTMITRLALGAGVAFLIYGSPSEGSPLAAGRIRLLSYLSIAWCLICWLPYQQIDYLIPHSAYGQLALGYVFHVALIASAAILATFFLVSHGLRPETRPVRIGEVHSAAD